jgi:hypothetical protein
MVFKPLLEDVERGADDVFIGLELVHGLTP